MRNAVDPATPEGKRPDFWKFEVLPRMFTEENAEHLMLPLYKFKSLYKSWPGKGFSMSCT